MKTAFIISTCDLWHSDMYEQIGVATSLRKAIHMIYEYLKSRQLRLNRDQYNMLFMYQQTQGLMRANNYPGHVKEFEIIINEVALNNINK